MRLWLSPHVRAVRIADDIVFLDVAADAYLCLAGAGHHLRLADAGAVDADPPQAADDLTAGGLLSATPTPQRAPFPPALARDLGGQIAPPSFGRLLSALSANHRAARAMSRLAFAQILDLVGPTPTHAEAPVALLTEARRFAALAPWLPHEGLCLMRSLQQRLYLEKRGHAAHWVFGVRTWPFEAHCWLQAGDVVLDDTLEHAGAFTPIMVV